MTRVPSLVLLCIALNLGGAYFSSFLNGLLFLDTIGTAAGALALGPWWGATIGAVTNGLLSLTPCRQQYHNYLIVNVACGLFWGVAGRTWLNIFESAPCYRAVLGKILLVGAIGGVMASTISLFTTFNFVWNLEDINRETFRVWHLTDRYYRWLLTSDVIDQKGNILQILFRDVIGILPDKIVSVAVATYVIYYGAPRFADAARNVDYRDIYPASGGYWLFGLISIAIVASIISVGQISIDPTRCAVTSTSFIPVQIFLWCIPFLVWMFVMIKFRNKIGLKFGFPLSFGSARRTKVVKIAYRDVLTILAGVFAVLIITSQRYHSPGVKAPGALGQISELMNDGFGILAFFAVFAFVPAFILRVFGMDPDVEDDAIGE
jgi:hypothetical protein